MATGIERDLVLPAISQWGGRWAIFSAGEPGYAMALRSALGPSAEIFAFDRDHRTTESLQHSLTQGADPAMIHVAQGDVTQNKMLHDLDGVVAANLFHQLPLDSHQPALTLLASYLRRAGSLIFIEAEKQRGSLRVRNPVDYESFEYFAGLIGLHDVRRVAIVPNGWWGTTYSALGFRD